MHTEFDAEVVQAIEGAELKMDDLSKLSKKAHKGWPFRRLDANTKEEVSSEIRQQLNETDKIIDKLTKLCKQLDLDPRRRKERIEVGSVLMNLRRSHTRLRNALNIRCSG